MGIAVRSTLWAMAILLQPVRRVSVRSHWPAKVAIAQPSSPAGILSTAITLATGGGLLGVLLLAPSPAGGIAFLVLVLGHALLSFAWEPPT